MSHVEALQTEDETIRLAVQERLDALVRSLTLDDAGLPREATIRRGLVDGVRAALDRLASGDTEAEAGLSSGSLAIGEILAHSLVIREFIGSGGMAEVYRVRHRDLRADYAVKILKPHRALDSFAVDCFVAEARALLGLRHDAILRAHAFLRYDDGRPFLLLDLVRGPTLTDRLQEGPLAPEDLRDLAIRLASALAALHEASFIHGDLSADNVVLAGSVQGATLIDLGLVHAATAGAHEIIFSGKWSSAAPEHLAGAPLTPACDLYALGLLLLAAATGELLALGHNLDSALAARRSSFDLSPLPKPLRSLVAALLDPQPAQRPNASACLAQLEALNLSPKSHASEFSGSGAGRRMKLLADYIREQIG
jgi:serine/threonine protein kinase